MITIRYSKDVIESNNGFIRRINPLYTGSYIAYFTQLRDSKSYMVQIYAKESKQLVKRLNVHGKYIDDIKRGVYNKLLEMEDNRL